MFEQFKKKRTNKTITMKIGEVYDMLDAEGGLKGTVTLNYFRIDPDGCTALEFMRPEYYRDGHPNELDTSPTGDEKESET